MDGYLMLGASLPTPPSRRPNLRLKQEMSSVGGIGYVGRALRDRHVRDGTQAGHEGFRRIHGYAVLMLVREWQAHDRRLGAHLTVKKGTERIDRKPQTSSAEQQCGVSKPRHMARSN